MGMEQIMQTLVVGQVVQAGTDSITMTLSEEVNFKPGQVVGPDKVYTSTSSNTITLMWMEEFKQRLVAGWEVYTSSNDVNSMGMEWNIHDRLVSKWGNQGYTKITEEEQVRPPDSFKVRVSPFKVHIRDKEERQIDCIITEKVAIEGYIRDSVAKPEEANISKWGKEVVRRQQSMDLQQRGAWSEMTFTSWELSGDILAGSEQVDMNTPSERLIVVTWLSASIIDRAGENIMES